MLSNNHDTRLGVLRESGRAWPHTLKTRSIPFPTKSYLECPLSLIHTKIMLEKGFIAIIEQ